MQTSSLEGGFADPPFQSAQSFRCVMEAMARPGTRHALSGAMPPAPLSPAAGAVMLTLCDPETPVYLAGGVDCAAVRAWISFHTGAPLSGPAQCMFAVGAWRDLLPLSAYPFGTAEYPDRSATLIVEMVEWNGTSHRLTGPGIRDAAYLPLPDTGAFQHNRSLFPLGLDFVFTCSDKIAAVPRSTQVSADDIGEMR